MKKKLRNKFSIADKEEAVRKVLEKGLGNKCVAKLLSTSHQSISLWVASLSYMEVSNYPKVITSITMETLNTL